MDLKKTVSSRTATLIRAVEMSQKKAKEKRNSRNNSQSQSQQQQQQPQQNQHQHLPADRGANSAGRMGEQSANSPNFNTRGVQQQQHSSAAATAATAASSHYVAMNSAAAAAAAAGTSGRATAAAVASSQSAQQPQHNNNNNSSSRFQRFEASFIPSSLCSSSNSRAPQSLSSSAVLAGGDNNNNNNGDPAQQQPEQSFIWELMNFAQNRNWKKKMLSMFIVASSFIVLFDLIFFDNVHGLIVKFLNWMTAHPYSAAATFIVFFVVATLLFVPPVILFFGAGFGFCDVCGFWYGIIIATIVSCIGSAIGATLAFLRSRYVMRELVELFAKRYPIVKAADRAFGRNGFHVMVLLRLCPIVPFNGLNYIGGVTDIELDQFVYALVGIVPTVVLWVLVGASADKLANTSADQPSERIFLICLLTGGVLFAFFGVVLLYRYAKQELKKEIASDRADSWHSYRKSESSMENGTALGSSTSIHRHKRSMTEDDKLREEGFEMLEKQPTDVLAVLGIGEDAVEANRIPEDLHDEEWFWVWT